MEKKINVSGQINAYVNFAMQQNYVPVVRSVTVHNESEERLENLSLKISFEPLFAKEYNYDIACIEAGESVEISPVKILMSSEYLFSLTEKMVGTVSIEVYCEGERLFEYNSDIEVLAYDQWCGLAVMPEIIAAFVTPNHPRVSEIVTKAGEYMNKWTGSPSFTGYQTENPDNVKKQMAAIYAALQSVNIAYNNPPASYEVMGQRIRLPHNVIEQKQGTCLDLAVLYCACLEAVGLYPLIAFKLGHAYAGCRLNEETFADCMVDDISAFEKRLVKGSEELLFVECTDFTSGKNVEFDRAVKHGCAHIDDIQEFVGVVDIQRSRGSGIRPIPLKLEQIRGYYGNEDKETEFKGNEVQAPKTLNLRQMADLNGVEEKMTKQRVWERKLLDFSLRNSLLNFRPGKNSLQLMVTDLGQLEDKLSDGKDFRVMEVPSEWTVSMRDIKMYEIENDKDLIENISTQEMKSNRVRTFLSADALDLQLKNMYRSAKVSMEENGTNTMFLALGFLRWFESDISEKPRYAPVVLIPIDIVRSLRNGGYVIRSRQEEARINITLLEYLRQIFSIKINGLDTLPEDEHGIDLPLIFHTVRQAVMGKNRWNLIDLAYIGLFSFGQFVMWNDIRNRAEELKENKVVSSLIEGRMNWTSEDLHFDAKNVETVFKPADMAVPLSADSSQLVAVAAAAEGRSFVLHGPPGTGKSQTITNMIANALYNGKTVLFAAEKMAALSVVQKRLASIGLDPFCLELHSNKTSKSVVLSQLNKALEVGRIKAPEDYEATAEKLLNIRNEFNVTIDALHKKREYGASVYEAIEKFEEYAEYKGKISLNKEFTEQISVDNIEKYSEAVRRFSLSVSETGNYAQNPWRGCGLSTYSLELRDEFERELKKTAEIADRAEKACDTLGEKLGIMERNDTVFEELAAFSQALTGKEDKTVFQNVVLSDKDEKIISDRVGEYCNMGEEYNNLYASLTNDFEESVLDYNVSEAALKLKQAQASWFLPKIFGTGKLLKELKLYSKNPDAINKNNLSQQYDRLKKIGELKQKIKEGEGEIREYIGGFFNGAQTDWAVVREGVECSIGVKRVYNEAALERRRKYREGMPYLLKDATVGTLKKDILLFREKRNELSQKYYVSTAEGETVSEYRGRLLRYADNMGSLKDWTEMREESNALKNMGLSVVAEKWEKGEIKGDELLRAYESNLYYALILKSIREDKTLANFRGNRFEDTIERYKELTEKFRLLTINELVARLSANVPASGISGASSSEVGILKKAIKSNGRMMSIRKLFDQIPNLLRKLCPCMLMSPISVAQYIDPSFPKFDLVIFDEASQLPTSEAVGTIARGENVIVVGDPNQLPPTSFFSSTKSDEDNMEMEDLESLLDDCLSISMPQEYLKWHYRSRHESLIAFSNMKYYDNKLFTFPSISDLRSAVTYIPIEGSYDKGRSKQNKAEAEAVVKEIIKRLKNEDGDSIGVVTFSSVQQNLIDDMLSEAFVKYPELEERDRASAEPVFIKNLENVQGDERDVILFSVGYGPDKDGKVSMNFGPLNREGGWRRLNVAVSRARKRMMIYSTLRPEQIDLSRTRSEGVAGLKAFLEYAQRGKSVLASKAGYSKSTDPLVKQMSAEIEKMGFGVKCNIGCSEYRIDMAIIDPRDPDKYLLGIMLDGSNSVNTAASDRFILQPGVLKGLGWRIMRVWTMEWLDDKQKILQAIKEEAEKQKESDTSEESVTIHLDQSKEIEKLYEQKESFHTAGEKYNEFTFASMGTSENFNSSIIDHKIVSLLRNIIDVEAPISQKALYKKVLSAWDISRLGSRVEARLDKLMSQVQTRTTMDGAGKFYWRVDQIPEEYSIYRTDDNTNGKRSMDDISSYEIINAIKEVLKEQICLSKKDLVRETAKKFGYSRSGGIIDNTVTAAIETAKKRGILSEDTTEKITLI
ncbi:MAG: DUF3320 domain-containing protein [Firmicutes bacterium]|nr:DUF3320 domain-containing protein [Bacillota bacterium]